MNLRSTLSFLVVLAAIALSMTSCKKSNEVNCAFGGWAFGVTDEVLAISVAAQNYQLNPTEENCLAYREAYKDYIKALQSLEKCVNADERADFQESLDEAEQDADDLPCN